MHTDAPSTVVPERPATLRTRLHALYHGTTPGAVRFRTAWLFLDIVIIAFFVAAPLLRGRGVFLVIDYAIAAIVALDLGARALAWGNMRTFFRRTSVWVDIFVLITLLFPQWFFNLGFLRVLRLWTLVNSEVFWDTIGRRYDDTRVEEITRAVATLLTFVFIVTGFVYTSFRGVSAGIGGYIDALYFTITSLTTTGYGDITLPGVWGRLLSIIIMCTGVTLFLRLAQAIFRPNKVRFPCQICGLQRHDPDAVHCKACGATLNIPNDDP
ncbi:MAG TPA: ion channel [Caulobacteraceae bacterium]|jgi:voltage-gated potassium channel